MMTPPQGQPVAVSAGEQRAARARREHAGHELRACEVDVICSCSRHATARGTGVHVAVECERE